MSEAALDPYAVLGVTPDVSDVELRRVYRGLVQRHHPDHNGGSPASAARFAQIQNAYAAISVRRRARPAAPSAPSFAASGHSAFSQQAPTVPIGEPDVEDRITRIEREVARQRETERRRAQEQTRAREQATRVADARRAQTQRERLRPTPEELGYYSTEDSFTKIIDDAAAQFSDRVGKSNAKKQFTRRLSDLFGRDD